MTEDLLRDIEADRQKEEFLRFVRTYKHGIIAAVLLIIGGIGGYFGSLHLQHQKTLAASMQLRDAAEALTNDRPEDAQALLEAVGSADTPFQAIALFRLAALYHSQDKATQEVAVYQQIRDTPSVPEVFRDYAVIRQGLALAASELPKPLLAALEKLAYGNNVWQYSAREILAMDALHRQDTQTALGYLMSLRDDPQAPSSLNERAGKLIETLPK